MTSNIVQEKEVDDKTVKKERRKKNKQIFPCS